jgi:hypothetical protein
MKKLCFGLAVVLSLASTGGTSYAVYDAASCFVACSVTNNACLAKITSVNDLDIKDETKVCLDAKAECDGRCTEASENDAREEREKAARERLEHPDQPAEPSPEQQEQPQQDQAQPPQ